MSDKLDTTFQSSIEANAIDIDEKFTFKDLGFNIAVYMREGDTVNPIEIKGYIEW